MDSYHAADIEPPLVPDAAPPREAGIPFLGYGDDEVARSRPKQRMLNEPGPRTEIGRAQRMAEVARDMPKARLVLASVAGVAAVAVAAGVVFLMRPRKAVDVLP